MEGWIKLYRQICDDELYLSEKFDKTHAWIDLLLLAQHKSRTFSKRGTEVALKPGDLAISIRDLATRWQWSVNTVQKFLKRLELIHRIKIDRWQVINVIHICKYQLYQQCDTQDDTQTDTQFDTQTDTQSKEMPPIPPKENLHKNDNNIIYPPPPRAHAYVGEEDLFRQLRLSSLYMDNICAALSCDISRLKRYIDEFQSECKAKSKTHAGLQDLKRHFFDWARIHLQVERAQPKPQQTNAERREELEALAARYYMRGAGINDYENSE